MKKKFLPSISIFAFFLTLPIGLFSDGIVSQGEVEHIVKSDHYDRGPCKRICRGPTGATGPTGPIGSQGVAGPTGPTGSEGPGISPAYIGRFYDSSSFNISGGNAILPLGNSDGGVSPVLLQYTDLNPEDPTADKFVTVLPGGAGKYLIQYSVLVSNNGEISVDPTPLDLQLQIDSGSGYGTSMPFDTFEPIASLNNFFPGITYMSGGVQVLVSLQDNDKVHVAVVGAPANASIGGGAFPTRSVSFTMTRINL